MFKSPTQLLRAWAVSVVRQAIEEDRAERNRRAIEEEDARITPWAASPDASEFNAEMSKLMETVRLVATKPKKKR